MPKLGCPACGGTEFQALEQVHATYKCSFETVRPGTIEIDSEPQGEFIKEDATSVTLAYTCLNTDCNRVIQPDNLKELVPQ